MSKNSARDGDSGLAAKAFAIGLLVGSVLTSTGCLILFGISLIWYETQGMAYLTEVVLVVSCLLGLVAACILASFAYFATTE